MTIFTSPQQTGQPYIVDRHGRSTSEVFPGHPNLMISWLEWQSVEKLRHFYPRQQWQIQADPHQLEIFGTIVRTEADVARYVRKFPENRKVLPEVIDVFRPPCGWW